MCYFFFFKQKTAYEMRISDWSSDVCSSDLPAVSNDNPFSESLFKTLKYRPAYPRQAFEDLGAARAWVSEFECWYNHEHRHSAIRFVTPAQRHAGQDGALLAGRAEVYEAAKARNPERWSGAVRDWSRIAVVHLNPENPAKPCLRQSDRKSTRLNSSH